MPGAFQEVHVFFAKRPCLVRALSQSNGEQCTSFRPDPGIPVPFEGFIVDKGSVSTVLPLLVLLDVLVDVDGELDGLLLAGAAVAPSSTSADAVCADRTTGVAAMAKVFVSHRNSDDDQAEDNTLSRKESASSVPVASKRRGKLTMMVLD